MKKFIGFEHGIATKVVFKQQGLTCFVRYKYTQLVFKGKSSCYILNIVFIIFSGYCFCCCLDITDFCCLIVFCEKEILEKPQKHKYKHGEHHKIHPHIASECSVFPHSCHF